MTEIKTLTVNGQAYSLADSWARQRIKELQHSAGAPVIVTQAAGKSLLLTDSSDMGLVGLTLYGRTVQDGTPTPEAPVDTVSIGPVTVTVAGADTDQSMAVPVEVFSGIPVKKDGNYTDENGQQWICDEIDLARGVYIRRMGKRVFDGTEIWKNPSSAPDRYYTAIADMVGYKVAPSYCTHFVCRNSGVFTPGQFGKSDGCYFYHEAMGNDLDTWTAWLAQQYAAGTPVTVVYPLTEPVETALDAELLAAFAALHTCYPETSVTNDADCEMAVSYVADTKAYIDARLGS